MAQTTTAAAASKSAGKAKRGRKVKSKKQQKPSEQQQQQQKPSEQQQQQQKPSEQQQQKQKANSKQRSRGKKTLKLTPAKQGGHCVLLSHLPPSLREPQLRRFVGQFGRVLRLRVPRSARTGGVKGVAFVELADPAAARAVADTLDNYLMFTRLLRCKVVSDPKRLTFAADGRRRRGESKPAAAAAPASDTTNHNRRSQRRLRAKVDRLKRLDPSYEFRTTD